VDKKLKEFFIRPPPYTNESQAMRYPPMPVEKFLILLRPSLNITIYIKI